MGHWAHTAAPVASGGGPSGSWIVLDVPEAHARGVVWWGARLWLGRGWSLGTRGSPDTHAGLGTRAALLDRFSGKCLESEPHGLYSD